MHAGSKTASMKCSFRGAGLNLQQRDRICDPRNKLSPAPWVMSVSLFTSPPADLSLSYATQHKVRFTKHQPSLLWDEQPNLEPVPLKEMQLPHEANGVGGKMLRPNSTS